MPGRRQHQPVSAARALAALAIALAAAAFAYADEPDVLLLAGEAALQRGDAATALETFERAAARRHSAAIEIGIVRSLMQMGQYRRALAFAGHTAFAHTDSHDAATLYAGLLRLGGQSATARRLIDAALQRAPGDVALLRARNVLDAPTDDALRVVLTAPVSSGAPLPDGAQVTGQATLLPDGRHALAPAQAVPSDGALWLRNGLGRTVAAFAAHREGGLVVLGLSEAMGARPAAARPSFPGSPAFVLAFNEAAAWPLLHGGFLGTLVDAGDGQWLGVDPGAGSLGAPVFDANARLIGMVLPGSGDGRLRLLSLASAPAFVPRTQAAREEAPGSVGSEAVYENGLRSALQVIAAR